MYIYRNIASSFSFSSFKDEKYPEENKIEYLGRIQANVEFSKDITISIIAAASKLVNTNYDWLIIL